MREIRSGLSLRSGDFSLTNEDGSLSRSKGKALTHQLASVTEAGRGIDFCIVQVPLQRFGALGFGVWSD